MSDRIRREKNVYYFDFLFGAADEDGGFMTFPSMPQNIKANNAIISVDKFMVSNLSTAVAPIVSNANYKRNFIVNLQTNIPCSNYFSSLLTSNGMLNPRTVGFGETIPLETYHTSRDAIAGEDSIGIMKYENNNPSRHILCANPFGNKYKINFFNVQGQNANEDFRNLGLFIKNKILTLKVELIEEEIIKT